jgi:hypothetical protein
VNLIFGDRVIGSHIIPELYDSNLLLSRQKERKKFPKKGRVNHFPPPPQAYLFHIMIQMETRGKDLN